MRGVVRVVTPMIRRWPRKRWFGVVAALAGALLAPTAGSRAQTAVPTDRAAIPGSIPVPISAPVLVVDWELAGFAGTNGLPAPLPRPQIMTRADSRRLACAGTPGQGAVFIVTAIAPSRSERTACHEALGRALLVATLARDAVILIAPATTPSLSLTPAQIFRALGANAPGVGVQPARAPARWSDLDPALPRAPVAALLAPSGSAVAALFESLIMEPGCIAAAVPATVPFATDARMRFCAALRRAATITQRGAGGEGEMAQWLGNAGSGGVAVISRAELPGIGGRGLVVAINDVLPTAANIAAGRYPAMRDIYLIMAVPRGASAAVRQAALELGLAISGERSFGPSGHFVTRGLSSLAAADRVALRDTMIVALEK